MADFGQLFPIRPGIQRLPITKSDAYLRSSKTAVARTMINSNINSAVISMEFKNATELKCSSSKYIHIVENLKTENAI